MLEPIGLRDRRCPNHFVHVFEWADLCMRDRKRNSPAGAFGRRRAA